MGYFLVAFQPTGAIGGTQIPRALGVTGEYDIGGGHQVAHPNKAGSGIVHHPLIGLPNGQVFDALGSGVATRAAMDITAKLILLAAPGETSVKTQLDLWLGMLGARGVLTRQGDDGSLHNATARLVLVDAARGYEHRRWLPITLTWTLTGLPWTGTLHTVTRLGLATGVASSDTWTNGGNVTQGNLQFTLTQTQHFQTISAVIVQNDTLSPFPFWSWAGTPLNFGESLFVDTGAQVVQRIAAGIAVDDYAHFTPPANAEPWFQLGPGATIIGMTLTGDALAQATLVVSYYDAWG